MALRTREGSADTKRSRAAAVGQMQDADTVMLVELETCRNSSKDCWWRAGRLPGWTRAFPTSGCGHPARTRDVVTRMSMQHGRYLSGLGGPKGAGYAEDDIPF